MQDKNNKPANQLENAGRREFMGKTALLGAGAVAAPMSAAMFASMAKAQAAEASNSPVVHPGELDEYYGFWTPSSLGYIHPWSRRRPSTPGR